MINCLTVASNLRIMEKTERKKGLINSCTFYRKTSEAEFERLWQIQFLGDCKCPQDEINLDNLFI